MCIRDSHSTSDILGVATVNGHTEITLYGDRDLDGEIVFEGEKVQIVNNNNGERFETYVIKGERNSGRICLNGAAARKAEIEDIVIIISYAFMTPEEAKGFHPISIHVDEKNKLKD